MNKNEGGISWVLFLFSLGLAAGLAGTGPVRAEEAGKEKPDLEAEAKEAKAEAEQERADRAAGVKGKYQRKFHGTFLLPAGDPEQDNPEVIGTFFTDEQDKKPNQKYLVKVEKGGMGKELLESLMCYEGKKVLVMGHLRNQNKYLVVGAINGPTPSPPLKIRQPPGSI
jgi:hypothetical protein